MGREKITSTKNPGIRNLIRLQKNRNRKKEMLFVVEGMREILMALEAGFMVNSLFFCPDLSGEALPEPLHTVLSKHEKVFEISQEVFRVIAYRENREGLIAVFRADNRGLSTISLQPQSMVVVLETVEKPGNLGAIVRTAEAAGCDALLVCNPQTDIYNPNVIRSSLGCIFRMPVVACSNEEALEWLRNNDFRITATWLEACKSIFSADMLGNIAVVMGSEADGISDFWIQNSDVKVIIPMYGRVNSLNVSAATAMVIYECLRQRNSLL
ncbi:MAG: RNA methyltransferase [Bacteroidales bacterium]|nr:RNA methyltransferase [Bacteroidales bacterium]